MSEESTARDHAAVTDLETVLAATEKLIGGTRPDQGEAPTPCSGMDVSQLVDHVLGWSATYAARAMGSERAAHGWDLARATGQDVPYGDREASLALETGRAMLKPEYRGPDKDFGAEVPVTDSAPAISQLVGFLGRDPEWAPPA